MFEFQQTHSQIIMYGGDDTATRSAICFHDVYFVDWLVYLVPFRRSETPEERRQGVVRARAVQQPETQNLHALRGGNAGGCAEGGVTPQ